MTAAARPAFAARLRAAAARQAPCLRVPLVLDALTARVCESLGVEAGYVSGGALGYQMAVSEALLTVSELAGAVAGIGRRSALPIIVDGGVGFGDPVHTARMMWDFEAAGAVAVEIEDQVAPKRASHHRGVEHLVPCDEMVAKIRVAAAERRDPDFLIIARTGAVRHESYAAALDRLRAYATAGADAVMLFPGTDDEWATAPHDLTVPVVAMTMMDTRPAAQWDSLGYAMVIDPMSGQVAAVDAVRQLYARQLRGEVGTDLRERGLRYRELGTLAGMDHLYDIERETTEPGT